MYFYVLGMFYYTLGNLDPKYRSRLHTIQLVTVVRTELIEECGPNLILDSFMNDIKLLESVRPAHTIWGK